MLDETFLIYSIRNHLVVLVPSHRSVLRMIKNVNYGVCFYEQRIIH